MNRNHLLFLVVAAMFLGATAQTDARLPGTLNFKNMTNTNVIQVVGETANNEKEVDFGDFDNDGDLDVVIGNAQSDFGQRRNKLYRNDDGVFQEVSGSPIIPGFASADVSRNAFLRDFDQDGWLDILIINDANTNGPAGQVKIYINKQVGGQFDHFQNEGTSRVPGGIGGPACSAQSEDFDGDGDIDFYSANYPNSSQDRMWFNRDDQPGFFQEVTSTHVPADNQYTVDLDSADMNGDGTLDLLVANWSNSGGDRIYYNNLNGAGSEEGDYRYNGSTQSVGIPGANENGMEAADYDNDGRMDIYHTNGTNGPTDIIRRNTGNSGSGQATFATIGPLPPYVRMNTSVKSTSVDLNHDGRIDVIVMMQNGRPAILRNTTVNGEISFVDWTPGSIPTGPQLRGWNAAAADTNGDGWEDVFVGGWTGDHLLVNADSNEVSADDIGTTLPPTFNSDPVAVTASITGTRTFEVSGVPGNQLLSSIVNSAGDVTLEVLNVNNTVVATSNRGALGIEEAVQVTTSAGGMNVRVTVEQLIGDADDDGDLDVFDFAGLADCVDVGAPTASGCDIFDFNSDGSIDNADVAGFQRHHSGINVPGSVDVILEVLTRSAN